eukprot:403352353
MWNCLNRVVSRGMLYTPQFQQEHQIHVFKEQGLIAFIHLNQDSYSNNDCIQGSLIIDVLNDNLQNNIAEKTNKQQLNIIIENYQDSRRSQQISNIKLKLKGSMYLGDFIHKIVPKTKANQQNIRFSQSSKQDSLVTNRLSKIIRTQKYETQVLMQQVEENGQIQNLKRKESLSSERIKQKFNSISMIRNTDIAKQKMNFLSQEIKLPKFNTQISTGSQQQFKLPFIVKLSPDLPSSFQFQLKKQQKLQIKYELKAIIELQNNEAVKICREIQIMQSDSRIRKRKSDKLIQQNKQFQEDQTNNNLQSGVVPSFKSTDNLLISKSPQKPSDSQSSLSRQTKRKKYSQKTGLIFTYEEESYDHHNRGFLGFFKSCCIPKRQLQSTTYNESLQRYLNYKVMLNVDKKRYSTKDTIVANVAIDVFPNLFMNQVDKPIKIKLQNISCQLKMVTSILNKQNQGNQQNNTLINQQTPIKQYVYDLCFMTEDLVEEVKLKQAFGSYQQFKRQFIINLESIWMFIDYVRHDQKTQSGGRGTLENNNYQNPQLSSMLSAIYSNSSYYSNSVAFTNKNANQSYISLSKNGNRNSKQSTRFIDSLKRLREYTNYTVESDFISNEFFLEITLQFDKSLFGVANSRNLSLPIKIIKKRDVESVIRGKQNDIIVEEMFIEAQQFPTSYCTVNLNDKDLKDQE